MNKQNVEAIFAKLSELYPDPQIELYYVNHFTLLVAIMLSAQATDKGVNKVTKTLFQKYNQPKHFASLTQSELEKEIKSIGLYKTKAANIIKTSNIIFNNYNSDVPDNFNDLIKLPGVGRKTANVYLANALGMPVIGVDTHVMRIANRLELAKSSNPTKIELELMKITPTKYLSKANHRLVLHGRYVCKARKPDCNKCILVTECTYGNKNKAIVTKNK